MTLKLRGEKSQLTDERETRLNEVGFRWVAPGFQKKSIKDWNPNDYYNPGPQNPGAPVPMIDQQQSVAMQMVAPEPVTLAPVTDKIHEAEV